jgi:hypothetical protein
MQKFFFGDAMYEQFNDFCEENRKFPELKSGLSYYGMTREEKMEHWWEKYNHAARINRDKYFDNFKDV